MSLRDTSNAIYLLLGVSFIDLSRMKWIVRKIGQKYFLFWRFYDLAKFTKMLEILWSATLIKAKHYFLFSISMSL